MAKILIIDDDITITELIKTVVKMEGFESVIVNDSTQALDVAKEIIPDMITIDVMMPNLSGLDLCALLRQEPQFANTPILIISAKVDAESKRRASQVGASGFISKPFRIDELVNTIRDLTS